METHAVSLFLSEIHDFSPSSEDDLPDKPIFLSTAHADLIPTVLLLDMQASIYNVCNLTSITLSTTP